MANNHSEIEKRLLEAADQLRVNSKLQLPYRSWVGIVVSGDYDRLFPPRVYVPSMNAKRGFLDASEVGCEPPASSPQPRCKCSG